MKMANAVPGLPLLTTIVHNTRVTQVGPCFIMPLGPTSTGGAGGAHSSAAAAPICTRCLLRGPCATHTTPLRRTVLPFPAVGGVIIVIVTITSRRRRGAAAAVPQERIAQPPEAGSGLPAPRVVGCGVCVLALLPQDRAAAEGLGQVKVRGVAVLAKQPAEHGAHACIHGHDADSPQPGARQGT